MINFLRKKAKSLVKLVSVSAIEQSIFSYFVASKRNSCLKGVDTLLVQCVEDPFYFALFGQIATSIQKKRDISIEQYIFRSLCIGETRSIRHFVQTRWVVNPRLSRKWKNLYGSFCDGVAYCSTSFNPFSDAIDLCSAIFDWVRIKKKENVLDLVIKGIYVGDLINDSYLRFKPAPTVDHRSIYVLLIIWQARRDIRRGEAYFRKKRPKVYLTSYSAYIQHGIPVRIALKFGVNVYSFGNYQEFTKKLSLDDWFHTKNPDNYRAKFANQADQGGKLISAELALRKRLSGCIDTATSYMQESAYTDSEVPVPEVEGSVAVFMHDFYDSPNVYPGMVFTDFWEWVCFTIETLQSEGIRFFLKPHPNQVTLSEGVVNELQKKYPGVNVISDKITNSKLVDGGIICAVTVYGTVAHEMAYLGVPSIACAKHPHIDFDFCKTTTNREDYAEALRRSSTVNIQSNLLRKQSLIFYYCHNLDLTDSEMELRNWSLDLRAMCATAKESSHIEIRSRLNQLLKLDGYKLLVSELQKKFETTYNHTSSN